MNKLVVISVIILFLLACPITIAYSSSFENELESNSPTISPFDTSKIKDVRSQVASEQDLSILEQMNKLPKGSCESGAEKGSVTVGSYGSHHWWGTGMYNPGGAKGVYAKQVFDEFLRVDGGNFNLYGGTLTGPNPMALEVGVQYYNDMSYPQLFVFNHYTEKFVAYKNPTQLRNGNYLSGDYYEVCIAWFNNYWGAYLWNYGTSNWDLINSETHNRPDHNIGWNTYEAYYDGTWPTNTQILKASETKIQYSNGNWYYVDAAHCGFENVDWPNGFPVSHGWITSYYSWWAGVSRNYAAVFLRKETYGGGIIQNEYGILGDFPMNNNAVFIDSSPGATSKIFAQMNVQQTGGHIKVFCKSQSGYTSDLYVYVSNDNSHWYQVGSWIGVGQTTPRWLEIGYYSSSFKYISVVGYYNTRPVYLFIDAVRVVA